MNATRVVGYTYNAALWHPHCIIEGWIQAGELSPAARDMDPGEVFWQYAEANGLDELDRGDSEQLPQPVFADQDTTEDSCDACLEPLTA